MVSNYSSTSDLETILGVDYTIFSGLWCTALGEFSCLVLVYIWRVQRERGERGERREEREFF